MTALRDRCTALLRRLGATGDPGPLADQLLQAWSAPTRAYHDRRHLEDCLARLDEAPGASPWRDLAEAALWFHDAIYDPRATDNEERSAHWAVESLTALGIDLEAAEEVARLVLLTRHGSPPQDDAGRLVCDVDLSILGRSPAEFDAYERRIREEYGWVPEELFRERRRRVLEGLLDREPLYQTDAFRNRYERAARHNLRRALAALGARA